MDGSGTINPAALDSSCEWDLSTIALGLPSVDAVVMYQMRMRLVTSARCLPVENILLTSAVIAAVAPPQQTTLPQPSPRGVKRSRSPDLSDPYGGDRADEGG